MFWEWFGFAIYIILFVIGGYRYYHGLYLRQKRVKDFLTTHPKGHVD